MKKLFSVFIFLLTLCLLVACNTTEELPENTEDSTVQTTESETSETEGPAAGGISGMYTTCEYDISYYSISSSFSGLIDREKYEEWLDSVGFYDNTATRHTMNIVEFIKYFNIPKEDFKAANREEYTDEQIDALYSNDKALLAQYHMNPRAINVDGEIYPPIWFTEHSLEEVQAAGITKEVLEEKYEDWLSAFSEQSDICQKTKEILDAWNEEISEETTGTDTTLTE